jgi:exosortase/archaeosortase family protein
MRSRSAPVLARVALILATIAGGFALFQGDARALEAGWAVDLLHAVGLDGVYHLGGGSVLVNPQASSAFIAVVAPSCSSIAAVMCLLCLGTVMGRGPIVRRVAAVGAAVTMVVVGNVVRIAASLAAGLVWGRATLVLFHDIAGSIFTFVYILGGFMVMLFVLLPRDARPVPARPVAVSGVVPPPSPTMRPTHA